MAPTSAPLVRLMTDGAGAWLRERLSPWPYTMSAAHGAPRVCVCVCVGGFGVCAGSNPVGASYSPVPGFRFSIRFTRRRFYYVQLFVSPGGAGPRGERDTRVR